MNTDLNLVVPEIFLSVTAMGVLILETFLAGRAKRVFAHLTIAALLVTGVFLARCNLTETTFAYSRMFVQDGIAVVFKMLFMLAGIFVVLTAYDFLLSRNVFRGEFFALLMFSTVGMMLVASAFDFLTLFVGLELASLATYILVGLTKKDLWSNEAAIKYFLLSIFASAILVFGISVVYAAVGTTNFGEIAGKIGEVTRRQHTTAVVALILLVAGFGFKITAVPFHMYAPDVYQGAPTPVTIFLAIGPKAAAFAGLVRVLGYFAHTMTDDWLALTWVLAFMTMTVGNVAAVLQTNVKRMLAYSSIAHAGYALIGVAAMARENGAGALPGSVSSVIFYLFAYTLMNVGAFSLLIYMKRGSDYGEELSDFSGLWRRRPAAAVAMLVCLLSLTGIPPSIGFLGKLYIFGAAIKAELYGLAVIGVLNSVVSLFYYLRVVVHMFVYSQQREVTDVRSFSLDLALAASALAIVLLGIFPHVILSAIERSAASFLTGGIIQ